MSVLRSLFGSKPTGMTDLVPALEAWEASSYPNDEYPPGSDGGEVAGVDLALLAGDVAAVLDCAIRGRWDRLPEGDTILRHVIPAIEKVLPELSPIGVAYFGPTLPLLIEVQRRRTLLAEAPST